MKKPLLPLPDSTLLLTSSCTPGKEQISSQAPQDQLANSVIAYSMSTDYRSAGGVANNPGGSIIFYNPDTRTWTDLATNGMEYASMAYDGKTLYFTDYETDYALTADGLSRTSHPDHEAPRIFHMFSIPENQGGGMVALANQGFTDDQGKGYLWDVIITQGQERTVHPLHHYITYATQCEDGSVWGLSDPYLTSLDSGYGPADAPQEVLQLYPDFTPDPITTISRDRMITAGTDLNCYDGVLYYITDDFKPEVTENYGGNPGDYDGSTLVSYDTASGEVEQRRLTGDWAVRISDESWRGVLIDKYAYDGALYWIMFNGDVVRTDLKTAHNTIVFTMGDFDPESQITGLLYFTGNYLFRTTNRTNRDAELYRYNLITGELESQVKIPEIKEVEKKYQFPNNMVVTDLEKALQL